MSDNEKLVEETMEEEAVLEAEEAVEETVAEAEEAEEAEKPLSLEEQLEAAQAEAAKHLDGWQRSQAELANVRRRYEKQRADTYINATSSVIGKLLPVLDDFDRALENVPEAIGEDKWFEGIQLVQRKLTTILENFNVTPIEALGQPFDPNLHEAIMQEVSDEYESGTVSRELQKGYKLGDKVVRPSLVYVAE